MRLIHFSAVLCLVCTLTAAGQEENADAGTAPAAKPGNCILSGFTRGGIYTGMDHEGSEKLYVPSAFADLGLMTTFTDGERFRAFADLRFRYGVEFGEPVTSFDLREAYVRLNGRKWDLTAGQQIIKWGRADFTNPTSNLSSLDMIVRSPDREDMNLGNLLGSLNIYPAKWLRVQADIVPFYRPSVLIIDPFPLPENVTFIQNENLVTGSEMLSYGLRADFALSGLDFGLSWFDGYDPMPGIALASFDLDLSAGFPVSSTVLETKPYKTRVLGFDFEASAGIFGLRGETGWSQPYLSWENYEYVAMPELIWAAGADFSAGNWRFTAEYNGKYITDYARSEVDPIFGTEPDYAQLAQYMAIPGFDPETYVRDQVAAFNRLYNYQIEPSYHSFGASIETELNYGRILPSVFSLYNFTSHEIILIPELKFKPADGLKLTVGAELYYGRDGSLYELINDFMNNFYFSLRVDF